MNVQRKVQAKELTSGEERDSIHRQPKARALIEKLETIKREAIEWG